MEIIPDRIEFKRSEVEKITSLSGKVFDYWESEFEESILFKEKIIINGNIYSLISDGGFAFLKETNIILYSSGIIYIDSSLNSGSSVILMIPPGVISLLLKRREYKSPIRFSVSWLPAFRT